MDVNLYWQAYKLLPYEKMLARKEVQALLKPKSIIEQKDCLVAKDCASPEKAECTTFFISYEYDGIRKETIQHIREGNERKRQNTRYYVHGIHEYKGKFQRFCHISQESGYHAGDHQRFDQRTIFFIRGFVHG